MKLEEIYSTIISLRLCEHEVRYINIISSVLDRYNSLQARQLISEIVQVYEYDLDTIGTTISNRPVLRKTQAEKYYSNVTDKDIVQDLIYVQHCLVAIAGLRVGLIHSYAEVAKELDI